MNAPKKVEAESLAQAMAAAFAEIEAATKGTNNPHFKTKYADLTSVIEAIKPALVAHNLFFTQHPRPNDKGVEVETILHHANGETFSLGSLFVPADRNNAQGFGSALTYARRYALVTAFGVPVEDDDGNAASKAPPRQQRQEQETDTPQGRAEYPFPQGPATGISQLKDMVRPVWRDLMSCGDLDELEGCIEAHKAIIDQASRLTNPTHRTQLWEGDGKDNPGLSGVIAQQRAAFSKPTILQAG